MALPSDKIVTFWPSDKENYDDQLCITRFTSCIVKTLVKYAGKKRLLPPCLAHCKTRWLLQVSFLPENEEKPVCTFSSLRRCFRPDGIVTVFDLESDVNCAFHECVDKFRAASKDEKLVINSIAVVHGLGV